MRTTLENIKLAHVYYRTLHLKTQLSINLVAYVEPMQLPMLPLPIKKITIQVRIIEVYVKDPKSMYAHF